MEKVQRYNKAYYDRAHKPPHTYQLGDYVLVKNIDTTPGTNKKLLPKYRGPYEVKKILENDRYLITDIPDFQLTTDIPDFQLTQRPFEGVYSPHNMRLWLH
ncbi:hypothetical protein QE152_g22341 [Popillia japonica]|uniref:Uncharacterized protein n=1 Tax=Popillia japonica TaxID=7064 RepID=A0AAW1KL93_POPJA